MQEQENKKPHECQCVGNKKVKKMEKEIEDMKADIEFLKNSLQRLRKAMK